MINKEQPIFRAETSPKKEPDERYLSRIKKEIIKIKRQYKDPIEFNKKYIELKDHLIKEHPEEALTIEVLFGLKDYAEAQTELISWRIKKEKIDPENIKRTMRALTEWQFAATYLLIQVGQNKKFSGPFWTEGGILNNLFTKQKFRGTKKGIIGQVGVYRLLEHFGLKPKLAHPDEDAFEKTDLLVSYPESNRLMAIQTKYTTRTEKPILMSSDEISYPSIAHYGKKKNIHISNKDIYEMMRLKESCQDRSKRDGKNTLGLYLSCPIGSFDSLSGEPTKEFLTQIEPEIKKYFYDN